MGRLLVTRGPAARAVRRAGRPRRPSRASRPTGWPTPPSSPSRPPPGCCWRTASPTCEPHLARAGAQATPTDPDVAAGTRIGLLLFSIALARARGDNAGVVVSASRALDELTDQGMTLPASRGYRAVALANLGTGQLWAGLLAEAEQTLTDALAEAEGTALDATRVNLLSHLALSAAVSGRLKTAHELASPSRRIVEERGWAPMIQVATAHLALAMVHLQRNELTRPGPRLARRPPAREPWPGSPPQSSRSGSTPTPGRVDEARALVARLRRDLGAWQPPAAARAVATDDRSGDRPRVR